MSEKTLGSSYQKLKTTFQKAGLDQAGLEAFLLLEWAANISYKDIVIDPDKNLNAQALAQLEMGLERRLHGESIHRIRGRREFYGLPFDLSPQTLEPRPDSEALIDLLLPFLLARAKPREKIHLLDMGTGSGALAIALLCQVPQLQATGVDIAAGALKMAERNAELNGVGERFRSLKSDWFAKVEGTYDIIISNPPYIAHAEIDALDKTVRDFDPILALNGGEDGLDFYRKLARESRQFLKNSGQIAVEIGQGQGQDVVTLFAAQGFSLAAAADDLTGIRRALLFDHQF